MQGGSKVTEQLQSPNQAAHPPLWRAQHGASGAKAQALCAGLESGANAPGLAGTGRLVAPPPASDPAQAVDAARDDVPRAEGVGGNRGVRSAGGRPLSLLVVSQRPPAENSDDHCVFRPAGSAKAVITPNSRTARCGPAFRVVWQGRLLQRRPPMPIGGSVRWG